MPAVADSRLDLEAAAQQIVLSPSDADYIEQLIPVIKDASSTNRAPQLMQALANYSDSREADVESMCSTNHQEFVSSVNQLLRVREGAVSLTSEILSLNQSIQASTEKLAEQKKALVDSRGVRQNLDEAAQALKDCLEVLRLANHVHELLGKKNHYAALRALDELQNVHLKEITQYKIADIIQNSVPAMQKMISEAVMTDLNTWLFRIRESSQFLGEVAFFQTGIRRNRQKDEVERQPYMQNFKLNSAVEIVADEMDEYDILDNDDLQIDFSPLFECLHIHEALNQAEKFRQEYAATRRQQKDLLLPPSIRFSDTDDASLNTLLESIAGFSIIERVTMRKIQNFRSPIEIDELWDSACQSAVKLITRALDDINDAEMLLKIKGVIALFIQTMDRWGYSVVTMDSFLLALFQKYSELLKRKFSAEFEQIVAADDYMPMQINSPDDYDNIMRVCWYFPDKSQDPSVLPSVLPFSQMYPLCCVEIRNFLNQFYFFADEYFQHPSVIDDTLRKSVDELLCEKVCNLLIERLNSQYLGQIVQILINLEHFETACRELEQLLVETRSSTAIGGPIELRATEKFRANKKTAEKRIFEVVNSKIDDLIGIAEYDWMATSPQSEPSNYMQTLTRFLSNIMNTTLLGLPTEIRGFIYFDALSHAATRILSLPLAPEVRKISPGAVSTLAMDVRFLEDFIASLNNPILRETLDELCQTILLMQSDMPDEFYDISARNKKYGRVDPMHGPVLLEKINQGIMSPVRENKFPTLTSVGSRFIR